MLTSDFWWLPTDLDRATLRICVGHHDPLRDHDEVPSLESWHRSLDSDRNLSTVCLLYPLSFVKSWHKYWHGHNVYRSLTLFDTSGEAKLLGPFLVDIDNQEPVDGYYQENLDDALAVARQTVDILGRAPFEVKPEDMRIFFSGRKGFNIEVQPQALGIDLAWPVDQQITRSWEIRDDVIRYLRSTNRVVQNSGSVVSSGGTVLDPVYSRIGGGSFFKLKHPYTRLHDSINQWIGSSGVPVSRRRLELSLADLAAKEAAAIATEATVKSVPTD